MKSVQQVADLVAEVLMPGAPGLVESTAVGVAVELINRHAVVELPAPSLKDAAGVTWQAPDGLELVRAAHGSVWVDDDILTPDQAIELAAGLLAAARLASSQRTKVRR